MKHKLAQKNLQSIQQWFDSELGQELLEAEKRAINRLLPSLFGYFLVEIAISPLMNLAADSLIGHKISTSTQLQLMCCLQSALLLIFISPRHDIQ